MKKNKMKDIILLLLLNIFIVGMIYRHNDYPTKMPITTTKYIWVENGNYIPVTVTTYE